MAKLTLRNGRRSIPKVEANTEKGNDAGPIDATWPQPLMSTPPRWAVVLAHKGAIGAPLPKSTSYTLLSCNVANKKGIGKYSRPIGAV